MTFMLRLRSRYAEHERYLLAAQIFPVHPEPLDYARDRLRRVSGEVEGETAAFL